MPNNEHLEIIKRAIGVWNWWRQQNPHVKPDFKEADLSGVYLSGANLRNAEFTGADLRRAQFRYAALVDADLRYASLGGANLTGADLRGADLTGSTIGWTQLGNNDLSTAIGLDTVIHEGPSTIGVDTIYRSKGNISKIFLQGAGMSENFIIQIPSLIGAEQAVQFYSCFISYSHKDDEFVRRLYSRLRDSHIRVWFAPEDIQAGRKLHEQLEAAIQYYDKLLIVLSENSLKSEWVITEIRRARKSEVREKRRKLFPIGLITFDNIREWECFDAETGKDLAVEVREYYVPDFSRWKNHDAFESAISRLLRDLETEEAPEGAPNR